MNRAARRRQTRAEVRQARKQMGITRQTEQRLKGVRWVQLAAWSRPVLGKRASWALLQRAIRHVEIWQRQFGGPWYRVSAHLEVYPDGKIGVVLPEPEAS